MSSTAQRLAQEAVSIFEAADKAGRSLTGDERAYVQDLLDRAEEIGGYEKRFRKAAVPELSAAQQVFLGGGFHNATRYSNSGPGDVFVQSQGFKSISDPNTRPQQFSTGLIQVDQKGTMFEGLGAPGDGTAGGLVPIPQVVPGVVEKLFQPLRFEQLLSAQQATTNTVRYIVEGTASSAAAGVAEGGTKPESSIALSTLDEAIKRIATVIITSDELLEDAVNVQSFINNRLSLFVNIESERQLLRGTASGNEVQGILTGRGVPVYAGGTAAGDYAAQLFKAMNGCRGSSFVEPEWVVMHPTDWQKLRLLQDSANQYLGGGPFQGQYGGMQQIGPSGQVTGAADTVWGKPVYVTTAIGGAGTALIGSSAAACIWSRGGLSVEATNSHASLFVTDQVAIRAERRLGLTVFRSGAFTEVRLA